MAFLSESPTDHMRLLSLQAVEYLCPGGPMRAHGIAIITVRAVHRAGQLPCQTATRFSTKECKPGQLAVGMYKWAHYPCHMCQNGP